MRLRAGYDKYIGNVWASVCLYVQYIYLNGVIIGAQASFCASYAPTPMSDNYNINFFIDLPLCQTIHKIDLTFMITLTVHQTYTVQSFRLPVYSLI